MNDHRSNDTGHKNHKHNKHNPRHSDAAGPAQSGPDTPRERLRAVRDDSYDEEPAVEAFRRLYRIVRILRAPDGCPWDREQTPDTMKESLVEEAYEALGALSGGDSSAISEELGDVILVATMIAYMREQNGSDGISEVLGSVADKLVRRHPHVFGPTETDMNAQEVRRQWDDIKAAEGKRRRSQLETAKTRGLPPLSRAVKLQQQAAKLGFDWESCEPVFEKVAEELGELRKAYESSDHGATARELGDLLFSVANLARVVQQDPSTALHAGNEKFLERFEFVAREMDRRGLAMNRETLEEMETLWQQAKKR